MPGYKDWIDTIDIRIDYYSAFMKAWIAFNAWYNYSGEIAGKNDKDLFGGGSGAGVTVAPVAFLVVQNGNVRTIQLSAENNAVERAVSMIPELVDKLSDLLKKQPQKKSEDPEQEKA